MRRRHRGAQVAAVSGDDDRADLPAQVGHRVF